MWIDTISLAVGAVGFAVAGFVIGKEFANDRHRRREEKIARIMPTDYCGYDPRNPMNCGRDRQPDQIIDDISYYEILPMGDERR